MQNTQTIEQSRALITGHQTAVAAKAAAEKAEREAAVAAEKARVEGLCEAITNVKYFKRKRVGIDAIKDPMEHYEQIRVNARRKDSTVFDTTGVSFIDGVKVQGYSLETALTLELSSEADFLAEKAKIESSTGSCCE
jgi:hypothetical protein